MGASPTVVCSTIEAGSAIPITSYVLFVFAISELSKTSSASGVGVSGIVAGARTWKGWATIAASESADGSATAGGSPTVV